MKKGIKRLVWLTTLSACMGSMQSMAQESFSVSGPVDAYVDLLTGETFNDYLFSAKITYTPTAVPDETYFYAHMEQSFFYDSFSSIEYTIYDGDGNPIENNTEIGDLNNITSVLNDLDLSDSITEQMYWYGDDPLSTVETRAVISFYDSTGTMVESVEEYPTPPLIADVDYGGVAFYRFNNATGEGLDAWGRITEVSFPNSFSDCALTDRSRRNRAQYIRCVIRVLRESRKKGMRISRADFLNHFVRNDELRSAYSNCISNGDLANKSFIRCFSKDVKGRVKEVRQKNKVKKSKKSKKSRKSRKSRNSR